MILLSLKSSNKRNKENNDKNKKRKKNLLLVWLNSEIALVNSIVKELFTGIKARAGDRRVE